MSTTAFIIWTIVTVIVIVCFFINPFLGILIGFWVWGICKFRRKGTPVRHKLSDHERVNPAAVKFTETIIREQSSEKMEPYDYSSHRIKRGALPTHVHDILDEMGITTWLQLSLLDEKELLYEKCFGQEALRDLKDELAIRGLTLNSSQSPI